LVIGDGFSECGFAVMTVRFLNLARDRVAAVAAEFAIVAPFLLIPVVGMVVFALAMINFLVVTSATESGAFVFAVSRGTSTPLTSTATAICNSAPGLGSHLSISMSVTGSSLNPPNSSACNATTTCPASGLGDSACATALASPGGTATVTATYPCFQIATGYFAPIFKGCNLSSTAAEFVQ
jgi:Flp pilus assembly protein TadG